MIQKKDLERISEYIWEIPADTRDDMKIPARIVGSERIIDSALKDESVDQLVNTATLPGMVGYTLAMPDIHQGYGFPIGGVAAADINEGVISPGGVGYDINCGVRCLSSRITPGEIGDHLERLAIMLGRVIPKGAGEGAILPLSERELDGVLAEGSQWLKRRGYASEDDLLRTESGGCLSGADPGALSPRAIERGLRQLGSLGSGNHFIEIDLVEKVYDQSAAADMRLEEGFICVQIHTGSRGLGHQVCTDTLRDFQQVAERKYGIRLVDRQLMCVPFGSAEGQTYFAAMNAAANYAFANRQMISAKIREVFDGVLAGEMRDRDLHLIYDITHNIAKMEKHEVQGKKRELLIHRKGATRAFGPGNPDLPPVYRRSGQPVLVPGSMGTASWVLAGTELSMQETFGSSCHGAGRLMSRHAARKAIRGDALRKQLERDGIIIMPGSLSGLAEEAPEAYKDVDEVVQSVTGAGIARKVARLVPLAVIKG